MLIPWITLALALSVRAEERFPSSDQPRLRQERTFDRSKDTSANESRDFRIRESASFDSTVRDVEPFLPRDVRLLGRDSKETEASRVRAVTVFATTTQVTVITTVEPPSTSLVLVTVTDTQTFSDLAQGRTTQTVTVTTAIPQKRAVRQIDARATTPSRPQPTTETLLVATDGGPWSPERKRGEEKTKEKNEQTSTVTSLLFVISRSVVTQTGPTTVVTSTVHLVNNITVTAPVSTTVLQTVAITTIIPPAIASPTLTAMAVTVPTDSSTPPTTVTVVSLPTGLAAGIAVGVFSGALVAFVAVLLCVRRARRRRKARDGGDRPLIVSRPLDDSAAASRFSVVSSQDGYASRLNRITFRSPRPSPSPPANPRFAGRGVNVAQPADMAMVTDSQNFNYGARRAGTGMQEASRSSGESVRIGFKPSPPTTPERPILPQPPQPPQPPQLPQPPQPPQPPQLQRPPRPSPPNQPRPPQPLPPQPLPPPQPPQPPRPPPPYQPPPPSRARPPPPRPPMMMANRPPPPRQPINFGAVQMSAEAPQPPPPRRAKLIRHPSALPSPLALGRNAPPLPRSNQQQSIGNGDGAYGESIAEGRSMDGGERHELEATPENSGTPALPMQGRNGPMMWTGNREGARDDMPGFL